MSSTTRTNARSYQGEADFWLVHDFLRRTFFAAQPGHNWEIRRWEGQRYHGTDADEARFHKECATTVRLWETADGTLVGVAHPEGMGNAHLEIDPAFRHLEDEMVAWAEEALATTNEAGQRQLNIAVFDYDTPRQDVLAARGFEHFPDRYGFFRRRLISGSLPEASLPPGYKLRTMRQDDADCARAAAVINAAFNRDSVTGEIYRFFQKSPSYRADLDVVVEAPDGSLGCLSSVTYDAPNRLGIFEPVCTHPDHQRKGLARAAMVEGLRLLADLGAESAVLGTGNMEAANGLYDAVGFDEKYRDTLWRKVW